MTFSPSPQQADFLNWVSTGTGSCVLEAVAGAGKTTTLLEAVARTGGNVAIMAYNKDIAAEISEKLAARGIDWKTARAGTVHSFGFGAYRKAYPRVTVDKDGQKVPGLILAAMGGDDAKAHPLYHVRGDVAKLVSLAKQRAIGVLGSIADAKLWFDIIDHFDLFQIDAGEAGVDLKLAVRLGQHILNQNNAMTDLIDFDDMVYMPLIRRVRFWRHAWIFVDEAQDTNPARRALVRAMLAPGGRVVAVGDRAQAIYGFTGADADSLDLIAQDFSATRLPLTTTYRCPKSVVAFAQQWVSHITCADTAPEGEVSTIPYAALAQQADLDGSSAVLCRNTKPLVALAFQLIRAKIACKVEGRDIGKGLIKLATRWKRVTTLHGLEVALEGYQEREVTKALARKKEATAQAIVDQCDTLRVIIDTCRAEKRDSIDAVVATIEGLFADKVKGILTLSTIHKSKGREWRNVYWLDRAGTLPSPYARQDWQRQQEDNLCYVAATRAKTRLIEVLAPLKVGEGEA
jgi:superfamily I DNA/RNA helicase